MMAEKPEGISKYGSCNQKKDTQVTSATWFVRKFISLSIIYVQMKFCNLISQLYILCVCICKPVVQISIQHSAKIAVHSMCSCVLLF